MSASSSLDGILRSVLTVLNPTQEDWLARFRVIEELREIVQSVESLRGATVEPFGSFVSRLFTRWGDLDISIELANGSYISSAGRKRKQNLLQDIFDAFKGKDGWQKLQLIQNARVPIVKVDYIKRQHFKISCDVSIDNLLGQMKSKMLFWINEIDGRFHDMVLLVKEWAKVHNINNSRSGTLNSYSLSLLVIFHFQTCVPAIFPPLRDIYPGNIVDDLTGVRADAERRIAETCAANIARFRANRSRVNNCPLSELLISFLLKFSEIGSNASELGICVYTGKWERIQSNTRWLPKTSALFMEDPFQRPENTTRSISMRNLYKMSNTFWASYWRLISANRTPTSLLAEVARPKISKLHTDLAANTPSLNNGLYLPMQMPTHRASTMQRAQVMHPPRPATRRFEAARPGSHASSSSASSSRNEL